jgi:hypothetical protein
MLVPIPSIFDILGPAVPFVVIALVIYGVIKIGPALADTARQRAYDEASAVEAVRLTIEPPAGLDPNPALATELIRGLHPRQRRGFDGWKVGWPSVDFRVVWRDRQLAWEVVTNRQMARLAEAQLRSFYPGVQVDSGTPADRPATAAAVGRLVSSSAWPLREVSTAEARVLRALAGALETSGSTAEVRLRLLARPVPPDAWHRQVGPRTGSSSPSMGTIIGTAIIDGLLLHETSSLPTTAEPPQLSAVERDAQARKRRGVVGFDVAMVLEVAGVDAAQAEALLWRLVHFTQELDDGAQGIRWEIRRGSTARMQRARLADWELAQLWYLPDASFDRGGFTRSRPLGAAPPPITSGLGLVIGRSGARPLAIPSVVLPTHLAAFGATGSGKSTLLLNLVLGLTEAEIGATVVDPHGDLTDDILSRLPRQASSRVRVLRLADREHPRGFNFLERQSPDQAQLVTSEFVGLFEDLWPRFCGPKMQHYLRHGLLTLLASREPQTVIELIRLLTDDGFREAYLKGVREPLLQAFWRTEWPKAGERDRDGSIKAVLNKLGAFVAYESIRNVVGQGVSTIRPRDVMDRGDLLLVDLSGVGGDNASLFGAMLVGRYAIDAVGRQGIPRERRRQHVLVLDEAQRFDTRAIGKISVEGRKFGLSLAVATQSLDGLGERLRGTILANTASLAQLQPGSVNLRQLADLFAPVTAEQFADMRPMQVVLKLPGPDGRRVAYGGEIERWEESDPATAAAIVRASDERDARPLAKVQAEVWRRSGGGRDGRAAAADRAEPRERQVDA